MNKHSFSQALHEIEDRIARACSQCGRSPRSVEVMAVTKTRSPEEILPALEHGLARFGENRVQEAVEKIPHLPREVTWELIGHLQRNKARQAVEHFARIQSVDSLKIARTIDRHASELGKSPFPVLLQFNAGEDPAKYGFSREEMDPLVEALGELDHLQPEGVMTIAPLTDDVAIRRRTFASLREIRDVLTVKLGRPLPVLSMGMTDDLEEAVLEGSTLVRVGTALFGARS
jgi:pyridoxal phosphate enzyme (YggS family)